MARGTLAARAGDGVWEAPPPSIRETRLRTRPESSPRPHAPGADWLVDRDAITRFASMAARRGKRPTGAAARRAAILEDLIQREAGRLRSQSRRYTRDFEDADDVFQEACLQFLCYYEGEPGRRALGWLMICIKHRSWSMTGSASRRSQPAQAIGAADAFSIGDGERLLTAPSQRPGPAEQVERREETARFRAALACLKPDERTALLLLGLGYSYGEISTRQGWTYTKVNRCLSEGRAALRAFLVRRHVVQIPR